VSDLLVPAFLPGSLPWLSEDILELFPLRWRYLPDVGAKLLVDRLVYGRPWYRWRGLVLLVRQGPYAGRLVGSKRLRRDDAYRHDDHSGDDQVYACGVPHRLSHFPYLL
jgi:hypothetical protein